MGATETVLTRSENRTWPFTLHRKKKPVLPQQQAKKDRSLPNGHELQAVHEAQAPEQVNAERPLILAVDDSKTQLQFIKATLEPTYRVHTASDIWIAHLVSELEPVLILLDVDLGCGLVGGRTVAEALNQLHNRSRLKVHFYSSQPEADLVDLTEAVHADGYICKTGDPDRLRRQVRRVLNSL